MNNMKTSSHEVQGASCDRQSKHLGLYFSIKGNESCVDSLQHLLYKINDQPSPENCESNTEKRDPTLLEVLNEGADMNGDITQRIHGLINQIDECLF